MLIFSNADWWLRLTSLIWFFPSVYLLYKITMLLKNQKVIYFAISLFSLHPLLVGLSFQVREYSMIICFMLLVIYLLYLNLEKSKLFRSFLIGILLAVCFFTSYASISLIVGLFFFMIYLFLSKQKSLGQNLLYSLCTFIITGFFQIRVLVNYFLEIKTHSQIAGSVPHFNFDWLVYQLKIMFDNDYLEFYIPLFLVINVFNLKKNKSLQNQLFSFLSLMTIILSILTSIFIFPNFLARQLVLFTLVNVLIFAQFHQKTCQNFVLIITLLVLTVNSLNAYNFKFIRNIENNIQDQIVSNSTVLTTDNYNVINYYLESNNINSHMYLIEGEDLSNKYLETKLLALPSQNVFFVTNYQSSDAHLKLKQDLQNSICNKHHCLDIEL